MEAQHLGFELGVRCYGLGALAVQTVSSGFEAAVRNGEGGCCDLTRAGSARSCIGKREIGQDRARSSLGVAIVGVVDAGGIEVHGFLHPPLPERVGEEAGIGRCTRGKERNVVQAFDLR